MASGRTEPEAFLFALLALALAGAAADLVCGRIFNWITVPSLVLGVAASAYIGGWQGLESALLAAVLGLLLYGWIFFFGAMGGGDVKFLMALGAWGGARFVVQTALLAIIIGGAISVVVLVFRGTFVDFLRRMRRFLMTVVIKELEVEKPKLDHRSTFPFGVPIALAAAWVLLANPFQLMGVGLW